METIIFKNKLVKKIALVNKKENNILKKRRITDADKIIGNKLRVLRKINNFSQKTLAERLNVTTQQIMKYEEGKNRLPIVTLPILADLFKIEIKDFFSIENKVVYDQSNLKLNFILLKYFNKIKNPLAQIYVIETIKTISNNDKFK